jgi:hypothetical protein
MTQTYLVVWIDDYSRFIVGANFYDNQRVEAIEDSFRDAVMKWGKPSMMYLDNGKEVCKNKLYT